MIHVLTIAGSDGSGGAGIQADIKTIAAHGGHGLSVITAITMQNTTTISKVVPVSSVKEQLEILKSDIRIDAVKIGMVYEAEQIKSIVDFIIDLKKPVVYDPVMISSTGKELMKADTREQMLEILLPNVTLLTPNKQEAEVLSGHKIHTKSDVELAAKSIMAKYACSVLLKGGHLEDNEASDLLVSPEGITWFSTKRIDADNTHGTGCCLSSAIACHLASGKSLNQAVKYGKDFTTMAIKAGYNIGAGEGPVDTLLHSVRSHL